MAEIRIFIVVFLCISYIVFLSFQWHIAFAEMPFVVVMRLMKSL